MSGDKKKTIYDMGASRKIDDVVLRSLTQGLNASLSLDLGDGMLEKILQEASGVTEDMLVSIDHSLQDETVITVSAQNIDGAPPLVVTDVVKLPDVKAGRHDITTKKLEEILAKTHRDLEAKLNAQRQIDGLVYEKHLADWHERRAALVKMGLDPDKAGPPPTMKQGTLALPDPDPTPSNPRVLTVQLPAALQDKVIGLRIRTIGEADDGKEIVEVEVTLHPDNIDAVSVGDIMFTVNSGHTSDPKHMSVGRVWVSTPSDYEAEIAKVEALVDEHVRQYENDGILEKLRKAYALVEEIGQHAKTITSAVSGQTDPMRINPNATYPGSTGPRAGAVSGKFLQEFLQAYDRLARVLNPVMIPPPKPKPRTIK